MWLKVQQIIPFYALWLRLKKRVGLPLLPAGAKFEDAQT